MSRHKGAPAGSAPTSPSSTTASATTPCTPRPWAACCAPAARTPSSATPVDGRRTGRRRDLRLSPDQRAGLPDPAELTAALGEVLHDVRATHSPTDETTAQGVAAHPALENRYPPEDLVEDLEDDPRAVPEPPARDQGPQEPRP